MSNLQYDRYNICKSGQGRAYIMMSGGGSNAREILKQKSRFYGLEIVGLFSDNQKSNVAVISKEFQLPCMIDHIDRFGSETSRIEYFKHIARYLEKQKINLLIYAGFMKRVPGFFSEQFHGINSHPADLLIKNSHGIPVYRGMNAIDDAVKDGNNYLLCSCHHVVEKVDTGLVISQSEPVYIGDKSNFTTEQIHNLLKEKEHIYYPQTIHDLCLGGVGPIM